MEYRIFPSIGIARLGNSPEFFVGPEVPGSLGRDITAAGETEVATFADSSHRKRKQAARFHLFERATATSAWVPASLPTGAKIRWTVDVANIKDAIVRPTSPPNIPPGGILRPTRNATRANRLISSGKVQIEGANATGKFLDGTHVGVSVRLGELRTDGQGRLLVLGGDGVSRSNPVSPIGSSFYNNKNWHDDIADGKVDAEVVLPSGAVEKATGAWVIVGPPDFAPGSHAIVSLYDILFQTAILQGWLANPTVTSFADDIFPLLQRARSLQWSHIDQVSFPSATVPEPNWGNISTNDSLLADNGTGNSDLREETATQIRNVETLLNDYFLPAFIMSHLSRWETGNFNGTWTGPPPIPAAATAESLTRSALDGTAGQGFFPGIEGGRILTDPSIYLTPFDFRIDHTKLNPGDVTGLMAQPWQADFLKCRNVWWPSQRPDIAPQSGGGFKLWARLGTPSRTPNHQELVDHVMRFGVVVPKVVGGVEVCVEEGRDPTV